MSILIEETSVTNDDYSVRQSTCIERGPTVSNGDDTSVSYRINIDPNYRTRFISIVHFIFVPCVQTDLQYDLSRSARQSSTSLLFFMFSSDILVIMNRAQWKKNEAHCTH